MSSLNEEVVTDVTQIIQSIADTINVIKSILAGQYTGTDPAMSALSDLFETSPYSDFSIKSQDINIGFNSSNVNIPGKLKFNGKTALEYDPIYSHHVVGDTIHETAIRNATNTFIWPNATGNSGDVLISDGSTPANLSWSSNRNNEIISFNGWTGNTASQNKFRVAITDQNEVKIGPSDATSSFIIKSGASTRECTLDTLTCTGNASRVVGGNVSEYCNALGSTAATTQVFQAATSSTVKTTAGPNLIQAAGGNATLKSTTNDAIIQAQLNGYFQPLQNLFLQAQAGIASLESQYNDIKLQPAADHCIYVPNAHNTPGGTHGYTNPCLASGSYYPRCISNNLTIVDSSIDTTQYKNKKFTWMRVGNIVNVSGVIWFTGSPGVCNIWVPCPTDITFTNKSNASGTVTSPTSLVQYSLFADAATYKNAVQIAITAAWTAAGSGSGISVNNDFRNQLAITFQYEVCNLNSEATNYVRTV